MSLWDTASLGAAIAAVGALGTAAFGLVDSFKMLPSGGISNAGYIYIEQAIQIFFKDATRKNAPADLKQLFETLHGNWINGTALADQKAIAKSLIKLRLNSTTAPDFAKATAVDSPSLTSAGQKMATGASLTSEESNALGRFDLALTAILDGKYQHADQRYRNAAKLTAMFVAIVLAFFGGWINYGSDNGGGLMLNYLGTADMWRALLAGFLATPLAPITKDLSSALAAGVKVAQSLRS
ncbi:hypothetical protein [Dyella flagellata]|uniref:Uncharacterized protein n=1 Tax=Dyella flagellata TaxID=1867833 RepID=A0ABQ5XEP5_9GAMM|nr:hypothetical protein [Dyella flagellata]GLQ89010.1 hypothetical protein GCM10007898_25820 [Dyella flagellata]